jgi:hypothetical protein
MAGVKRAQIALAALPWLTLICSSGESWKGYLTCSQGHRAKAGGGCHSRRRLRVRLHPGPAAAPLRLCQQDAVLTCSTELHTRRRGSVTRTAQLSGDTNPP